MPPDNKGTKAEEPMAMPYKQTKCNAPSGVLGSPTWTHEVMQGNSKGTGFSEDPSVHNSSEGSEIKVEV